MVPGSPPYRGARGSKARAIVFGAVALGFGLFASFLVSSIVARSAKVAAGAAATAPVVVVNQPVPAGTTVGPEMVELKKFPADAVPEGALTDTSSAVDRVVRFSIAKGEPIVELRLAPRDSGKDPSALVPPQMRAVTVRVNEAVALASLIRPGMWVDVIATMPGTDERGPRAHVILQKVQVLAVGTKLSFDARKTGTVDLLGGSKSDNVQSNIVTLVVTPDQSERLALAGKEGDVQIAIRNVTDTAEPDTAGANVRALMQDSVPPGAAPAEEATAAPPPAPRRRADHVARPADVVQVVR